jgi:hypothetical protein
MGIQKKRGAKKQGGKPRFFPFFQEVKSRDSGRDFFRTGGVEDGK